MGPTQQRDSVCADRRQLARWPFKPSSGSMQVFKQHWGDMIRHLIFMTFLLGLGACVDDSRASLAEDMGLDDLSLSDAAADVGDARLVDTGDSDVDGGGFVVP